MFDAYAHVGLPRFLSAEDYLALMDRFGIERALVCPFDACPDIREVHRAMGLGGGRVFGLGLALGEDDAAIRRNVEAQLDAGFIGLRFSEADVLERPVALDVVAERSALALVVGNRGLERIAPALLAHLSRGDLQVVGAHFAGPMPVAEMSAASRDLFDHPGMGVVFSRQTFFPEPVLGAWAEMLLSRMGWERIMWGTEAPVLFWRDDGIGPAPSWIERFAPGEAQREAFFRGTAQRFIFDRAGEPRPLALDFEPFDFDARRRSPFFPFGLELGSATGGRLVAGWLAWGGEGRGPLSAYLDEVLCAALPELAR